MRVRTLSLFALLCLFQLPSYAQNWIRPPASDSQDQRWTISGEVDVAPGEYVLDPHSEIPTCKDRREETSMRSSFLLRHALQANIFDSLKPYATSGGYLTGSSIDALRTEVATFNLHIAEDPSKKEPQRSGRDFAAFINQLDGSRHYAGCATIALIVPGGAREMEPAKITVAEDNRQFKPCDAPREDGLSRCSIANSGFLMYHDSTSPAYVFVFKNWSKDRTRHVRVSMLFTPPLDYVPPEAAEPDTKGN